MTARTMASITLAVGLAPSGPAVVEGQSLGDAAAQEQRRRGQIGAAADESTRVRIGEALSRLMARRDSSWIVFSASGDTRPVNISRTKADGLEVLLQLRVMDSATRARAVTMFQRWHVVPKSLKTIDPDSTQEFIEMDFGKDITLATNVVFGMLREVYLLPPEFRLSVELLCMVSDRPTSNCN